MNGERPTYTVMVESRKNPGKMTPATRQYVQRASAFKRAAVIARLRAGEQVNVWEYGGPGNSRVHVVQESAS